MITVAMVGLCVLSYVKNEPRQPITMALSVLDSWGENSVRSVEM
jgi:hypothetical protein